MVWKGFALAFCAAISHSSIDLLRKIASKRFNTTQCVCIVALLEGSLSFSFVLGQGTLTQKDSNLLENRTFLFSAFMSAALRLVSLLLYQTAIQLSPLSVTIPYLSFTPAMLLVTAYLIIGEQPSGSGLLGVVIVTIAGYLLAATGVQTKKRDKDGGDTEAQLSRSGSAVSRSYSLSTVDNNSNNNNNDSIGGLEMGSSLQLLSEQSARGGVAGAFGSAIRSLQQLGDSKGSVIMCLVAFLWSLTSTFDKMGMHSSPTLAAYLAVQRAMTALPCALYLILKDPSAFRLIMDQFPLMMGLVSTELLTVLLYLWSLKFLFVSYAVAAKRTGILLSVLSGWLFFGEHIRDKIVYILIMLSGMMLIVLAPDIRYNLHLHHP